VPFKNCAISDPHTFMAGLPLRLDLGHLLTGIREHHASLLQYWSGAKYKWTVVRGHCFRL